jgi:hypothetical protein
LADVRDGGTDDSSLFSLFATIAREVGRSDLAGELTRRAGSRPELAEMNKAGMSGKTTILEIEALSKPN